jgi:hypothetical protein
VEDVQQLRAKINTLYGTGKYAAALPLVQLSFIGFLSLLGSNPLSA